MDAKAIIEEFRPDLKPFEEVYKDIHRNPELSKQEVRTSALVAAHLESIESFTVHKNIGGYGVVGVLKNGPGSTVLLRADMDALPHREETGLEYGSIKVSIGSDGVETPVMHACGHDLHVTTLMAAAKFLDAAKEKWNGTLICLFQPSEETASGAQAMVDDGLWNQEKYGIPIPDIVLGQHVHPAKSGRVILKGGPVLTAIDSYHVRIYGKSGHICRADLAVDPVITASHIVVRLQSIVTKEVRPEEFAVIGCASINGGSAMNIIPDYVDLRISIRSFNAPIHERLLKAVKRVIYAECSASGSLEIREPLIETISHAPATINDEASAEILKTSFGEYFGSNLIPLDPFGASEDFSVLARSCGAPYVFYMYGMIEPSLWEEKEKAGKLHEIPSIHSSKFAPCIQPTMKTGVDAFALAALTFFERGAKN